MLFQGSALEHLVAGIALAFLSAFVMLPTYRRPWNEVQHSGSAIHTLKLYFSKPSFRWLFFCFAFVTSLWFLGPFLLHMSGSPPYRHRSPHRRPPPLSKVPSTIWSIRADQVKNAFLHAWDGYQRLAVPADELLPVSGGKVNK